MTDFEHELKNLSSPPPKGDAKRRAISAAMEAFNQESGAISAEAGTVDDHKVENNLQGNQNQGRLTDETYPWRTIMAHFFQRLSKRSFTMGLASACVLMLGVVFMFPLLWQRSDDAVTVDNRLSADVSIAEKSGAAQKIEQDSGAEADAAFAPPQVEYDASSTIEEVVVTGIRAPASRSGKMKRDRRHVEAISAEDIGRLLDSGVADALQRVKGVAIEGEADGVAPTESVPARDDFSHVKENTVKRVKDAPVSTFSIDVDTASYSYVRGALNGGYLPEKDAIRIEEMVNYFDYDYPLPTDRSAPFQPNITVLDSPWAKGKKLVHIGLKGYDIAPAQKPRTNLVFLLDVSGSMNSPNKLPLVKQSMELLLSSLHPDDTVAIVVYAGAAGTVLEPTKVKQKQTILSAMQKLRAGGSTAGGQGLALAYDLAEANFDKSAVNRIILATDGDFNVGTTKNDTLQGFVERKREKGIYLSVLGFGRGNYQDDLMQALAQNGNGVAAYIDTLSEAQKVLVQEASSSLFPIAKDVKIQVEFNPATVAEYRLIGYETRALNREDFNNDAVDAGDVGAGHTVTAVYEITPIDSPAKLIDPSRYGSEADDKTNVDSTSSEYGYFKLRYKLPSEDQSRLIDAPIPRETKMVDPTLQREVAFSLAVTALAQKLKGSHYLSKYSYEEIIALAHANKGDDEFGYRTEFVQLVRKAEVADDLLR